MADLAKAFAPPKADRSAVICIVNLTPTSKKGLEMVRHANSVAMCCDFASGFAEGAVVFLPRNVSEQKNLLEKDPELRTPQNLFSRIRDLGADVDGGQVYLAQQELRPVPHHYFFQRPRALQYTYRGERINYGEDAAPIQHQVSGASAEIKYTAEGIAKSRERIDLFIDLVWVGIISNLSEVFAGVYFAEDFAPGRAFLLFILVFLPAWRIWNFLREFLNSYYMDDTIQRVFIFWILCLSVFFGNELAYFAEHYESVKQTLIIIYVIIRGSFVWMEIFYSLSIPWIRKLIFVNFCVMLPATGLWIGAIFSPGSKAVGPALAAIVWEYLAPTILESPLGARLHSHDYSKEVDPIHLRGRMGNFLIITIGEGVLMLVRGGPLGEHFNSAHSSATWALLLYFLLTYLYFSRDGSVRFIPAVRQRGWKVLLWISIHIPIFASFITLSSGILWFVNRRSDSPLKSTEEPHELSEEVVSSLRIRALWDIGTSLSIIIFGYTCLALLEHPLDPPKTTIVSNRLLRLVGRPIYIIIILAVIVVDDLDDIFYFGICALCMSIMLLYEMVASLERPAKLFEPKGLTVLMKKEYRQERPVGGEIGEHELRIPI